MMITAKNYVTQSANIDFSKLSPEIQKAHENTSKYLKFYDKNDQVKRGIDAYLTALNKQLETCGCLKVEKPAAQAETHSKPSAPAAKKADRPKNLAEFKRWLKDNKGRKIWFVWNGQLMPERTIAKVQASSVSFKYVKDGDVKESWLDYGKASNWTFTDESATWSDGDGARGVTMSYHYEKPEVAEVKPPAATPEPSAEPLAANELGRNRTGSLQLVKYSDKSIAVIGPGTKDAREDLKKMGARFNGKLTVNDKTVPGWILPVSKAADVLDYFGSNVVVASAKAETAIDYPYFVMSEDNERSIARMNGLTPVEDKRKAGIVREINWRKDFIKFKSPVAKVVLPLQGKSEVYDVQLTNLDGKKQQGLVALIMTGSAYRGADYYAVNIDPAQVEWYANQAAQASKRTYSKMVKSEGKDLKLQNDRKALRPYSTIYDNLLVIFPDLEKVGPENVYDADGHHVGLYVSTKLENYDRFVAEVNEANQTKFLLDIGHYYVQEGDMMSAPRMEVRVDKSMKIAEAFSYEAHNTVPQVYKRVYDLQGRVDMKEKKYQNDFLLQWTKNLIDQGFTGIKLTEPQKEDEPVETAFYEKYLQGKELTLDEVRTMADLSSHHHYVERRDVVVASDGQSSTYRNVGVAKHANRRNNKIESIFVTFDPSLATGWKSVAKDGWPWLGIKDESKPKVSPETIAKFDKYFHEFYGKDGIYAIRNVTREEIKAAIEKIDDFEGDSVDREKVRDILFTEDEIKKAHQNMDSKMAKFYLQKYKENEANNEHTENLVMLAQLLGNFTEETEALALRDAVREHRHRPAHLSDDFRKMEEKASVWYKQLVALAGAQDKPEPKKEAEKAPSIEKLGDYGIYTLARIDDGRILILGVTGAETDTFGAMGGKFNPNGRGLDGKKARAYYFPAAQLDEVRAALVAMTGDLDPSAPVEQETIADIKKELFNNRHRAREMDKNEILGYARRVQKLRSARSVASDNPKQSRKVLEPSFNNLLRWINSPAQYDMQGVDVAASAEATVEARIGQLDKFFRDNFGINF